MLDKLWNRIQRERKVSVKKATLAALLLLGSWVWIPTMMHATIMHEASVKRGGILSPPIAATTADTESTEFWSRIASVLVDDPLFQPAEVGSFLRNPFQSTEVPESQPVLIEEEIVPKVPVDVLPNPVMVAEEQSPPQFDLRSTIIGRNRRAALINRRMYQLGRTLEVEGRPYLLTKIESNRVELRSGDRTIELMMSRPNFKEILNHNHSTMLDPLLP